MALAHPEPLFSPSSLPRMSSTTTLIETKYPHVRAYLRSLGGDSGPDETEAVVQLLDQEREEDVKRMLRDDYGIFDSEILEQSVLELMHKHRDDLAGIPFLHLTQTRRPISRPNSRPSSPSVRISGSTPPSSPRAIVFRRPHTPATSPLANGLATSYMSAGIAHSPSSSPTLAYARVQYTASLPASPLSSPRLLNAKAHEFKPIPRPLSAASSHPIGMRTETPSPDLWAHTPLRTSSNLAIAAPLVAEHSHLRDSRGPGEFYDDDDDDISFDPFPSVAGKTDELAFLGLDYDAPSWSHSTSSGSSNEEYRSLYDTPQVYPPQPYPNMAPTPAPNEQDDEVMLTDGMTPFDVLSSVFGSSIAPSELEEGLAANGYDFEKAMAWLIERSTPAQTYGSSTQQQVRQSVGGRVTVVSRDAAASLRGRGALNGNGRGVGRGTTNNRVCRYFVAGECLRADCRFSHDLERALCRFWLRGTCAKNEACEFLHHLPKDVDVSQLTSAMSRANIGYTPIGPARASSPPPDEFPVLGRTALGGKRGGYNPTDLSRTRFATAVKKPAQADPAREKAMGRSDDLYHRSAIIAPRPSPRIALRSPVLLPTLPTGESLNSLYLAYRSRALQLGAARNACLSRAADAWRRGDGAAAKRFSREGHDLNTKMNKEMTDAAGRLVRERVKIAVEAVKARDPTWSDDPGDRGAKGKLCGNGLGVILGIASASVVASSAKDKRMTPEERTECMVDLHGLHANEATEVLEEFLMALEREHFYGLTYIIVGEEKHVGTQDPARGASRVRLAKGVKEFVHRWSYPWQERDGIICVDVQTHATE